MPYCAACGKEITGGNYCPYCGKPALFTHVQPGIDQRSGIAMQQPAAPQYFSGAPPAAYIPYSSPQPATVSSRTSSVPARWVLICSCVGAVSMCAVVIASFLPWVSYSGINIGGIHRDGRLVLLLGLLGIASAIVAAVLKSRWPFPVLIALGIIVAWVILIDILDVTRTVGLSLSNVGVGMFLGAAAVVITVVAGAAGSSLRSSFPSPLMGKA